MKCRFLQWNCNVEFYTYQDGSTCIKLTHPQSGPIATATVCLVDFGYRPPSGYIAVKNYSENEGMVDALARGGVIYPVEVRTIAGGNVSFPIHKLTDKAFAELMRQKGK